MTGHWHRWVQFRLRTLLAALVLAGIGLGLFRSTRVMPVAKTTIAAGSPVDAKSIVFRRRFSFQIPNDAYLDTTEFVRWRSAQREIEAGEYFTSGNVAYPSQPLILGFMGPPPTHRAYAISTPEFETGAATPNSGDRVDVMLTLTDNTKARQTTLLLPDIEVLAVQPSKLSPAQRNVTLKVTFYQAAILQHGCLRGELSIALSKMTKLPQPGD